MEGAVIGPTGAGNEFMGPRGRHSTMGSRDPPGAHKGATNNKEGAVIGPTGTGNDFMEHEVATAP